MKNNKDSSAQTPQNLLHDLQALVVEAEKMMSESVGEHTEDAMTALRTRFHSAQERFDDIYDGARRRVVAGAKCTDESIRANPYQAIAIAAGVGLLLGLIVGRRCNR